MNFNSQNFPLVKNKLQTILNNFTITSKSLFSGHGLFVEKNMFAIYKNGLFYLRAEDELIEEIAKYSCGTTYKCPQNSFSTEMNYFIIKNEYLIDEDLIKNLILKSLAQIKQQKLNKKLKEKTKLRSLPNINIKYERLLAKINIFDIERLREYGSAYVYAELRKQGFDISTKLYWNIYAGLMGKNVLSMSLAEKKSSFEDLNNYLSEHKLSPAKWPHDEN